MIIHKVWLSGNPDLGYTLLKSLGYEYKTTRLQ